MFEHTEHYLNKYFVWILELFTLIIRAMCIDGNKGAFIGSASIKYGLLVLINQY